TTVLSTNLLNELDRIRPSFILVLDDYHRIQETAVHNLIAAILKYPPPALHLVIVGRRDPFLPISSLRAQRLMTEIRTQDLRFTAAETETFINKLLGIQIDPSTALALEQKTEGWVTGIHLATLSMRHRGDIDTVLLEPHVDAQYVMEYLFNEVLSHQPPEIRQYLLGSAILDRFCGPLCEAASVPGVEPHTCKIDGWAFIAWLKKENLFLIPLDAEKRWFRYHHQFQKLLQNQLNRRWTCEEIATLHSRASAWFEAQGLVDEAIHHALASGNAVGAAEIVERHRLAMMDQEKWYVLQAWLKMLPAEIMQQRPKLVMVQLFILVEQFRLPEMPALIKRVASLLADETADEGLLGELDFHRGLLLIFLQGDSAGARKRLEKARKQIPQKRGLLASRTELYLALARHMIGEGRLAIESIEEQIHTTGSGEVVYLSRLFAAQIYICMLSGELAAAVRATHRLRRVAVKGDLAYAEAWSHYLEANAALRADDLDKALPGFIFAAEKRNILNRRAAVDALAGLVLVYQALQLTDDAADALEQLRAFVQQTDDPQYLAVAKSCRARHSLLQGDLKPAMDWARSYQGVSHAPGMLFWLEIPAMTQARVQVAAGTDEDLGKALESLGALRQQVEALHFTCHTIEILVLQALTLEKLGRDDEALSVLEEVVALAGPRGWVRPFVESGRPMADLLKRLSKQNVAVDQIEKILAAFKDDAQVLAPEAARDASPPPLVEPLTHRELDVLELLARRLQNKEIAAKLFISVETVKKPLSNIYPKL
ncbi:MAG: hypothetical protein JJV98_13100, partial [Desulfosarcina sp.]|nr:hypothetical protein [Desulfobacterales bacterium]